MDPLGLRRTLVGLLFQCQRERRIIIHRTAAQLFQSWASASSLVSVGLSFSQAMGANVVASTLTSVASVANARQGALYHIVSSIYSMPPAADSA